MIDQDVLAARLGIDKEKSDDWGKFIEAINPAIKYNGVFSEAWDRWWSNRLLDWWDSEISNEIVLINSSAEERVALLKEKLNLQDLEIAQPIESYMSNSFWTVCKALNQPLDIYDGLVVNQRNETWQDKEYVSPKAVFEGVSKKQGIKLHPNERVRYEEMKQIYNERKYGNK